MQANVDISYGGISDPENLLDQHFELIGVVKP